MENKIVENILWGCLILALFGLIGGLMYMWLSPKHVYEYYLAGDANSNGGMYLYTDIENACDLKIALNGISFQEAVTLVDSLNRNLEKAQEGIGRN